MRVNVVRIDGLAGAAGIEAVSVWVFTLTTAAAAEEHRRRRRRRRPGVHGNHRVDGQARATVHLDVVTARVENFFERHTNLFLKNRSQFDFLKSLKKDLKKDLKKI